jgi:poly(ADP-ribose) glycohydrolase ARH3
MSKSILSPAHGIHDRFEGCLLGLAIGDALGGRFEGRTAESIREKLPTVRSLIDYPKDELWYTDDTQMAIGVAETLADHATIVEEELCKAFVANYVPSRGYGRGARAVLDAMEDGKDYREVAGRYFPGGSFGNGAAMRVAPIGLFFRDDPPELRKQAHASALPTHLHPLGIEGAQLLALAVALASQMDSFDSDTYFAQLLAHCEAPEYRGKLEQASDMRGPRDLAALGNGIEALESVPTAIAAFALEPRSYEEVIARVIFLGGDTDTLAAMAGAISGAFLGSRAIPSRLVGLLENSPKGRPYLIDLSARLYLAYERKARKT